MDSANLIVSLIESVKKEIQYRPLVLGGWSGPYGGAGGPPGGFIGYLPQTRVAYDETESEDCTIPSGVTPSLLHNLNRIRCRIKDIENSLSTGSGVNIVITNRVEDYVNYGVLYVSGTRDPYQFRSIYGQGAIEFSTDTVNQLIVAQSRAVEFVRDPYPTLPSGESLIYREFGYGNVVGKEIQLKKLRSPDGSISILSSSDGYLDLYAVSAGGAVDNVTPNNPAYEGVIYVSGTNNPQLLRKLVTTDGVVQFETIGDEIQVSAPNTITDAVDYGGGTAIYASRDPHTLYFRPIKNSDGHLDIFVDPVSNEIVIINNRNLVSSITNTSGASESIIVSGNGPISVLKGIKAGSGISVTSDADNVIISSSVSNCPEFVSEVHTISGYTYNLGRTPSGAVQAFANDVIQNPNNYTVSGNTVTFTILPATGTLYFFYVTCDTGNAGYGLAAYGTSGYGGV